MIPTRTSCKWINVGTCEGQLTRRSLVSVGDCRDASQLNLLVKVSHQPVNVAKRHPSGSTILDVECHETILRTVWVFLWTPSRHRHAHNPVAGAVTIKPATTRRGNASDGTRLRADKLRGGTTVEIKHGIGIAVTTTVVVIGAATTTVVFNGVGFLAIAEPQDMLFQIVE